MIRHINTNATKTLQQSCWSVHCAAWCACICCWNIESWRVIKPINTSAYTNIMNYYIEKLEKKNAPHIHLVIKRESPVDWISVEIEPFRWINTLLDRLYATPLFRNSHLIRWVENHTFAISLSRGIRVFRLNYFAKKITKHFLILEFAVREEKEKNHSVE